MVRFPRSLFSEGCRRFAAGWMLVGAAVALLGQLSPLAAQSTRPETPGPSFAPEGRTGSHGGSAARLGWPAREQTGSSAPSGADATLGRSPRGEAVPERPASTPRRLSRRGAPPDPATGTKTPPPAKAPDWKKSLTTVGGALGIVLGGFVLLVVLLRQFQPPGLRPLPRDAFEVLGRAPLDGKHALVLIRLGAKAALLSVRGEEVQTVLEIDDPDQVAHLAGLCQQGRPQSATAAFQRTLQQLATDPAVAHPQDRSSSNPGR